MNKLLFLAIFLLPATVSFAGNAELFKVDESSINEKFSELTELENFVVSNNFISLNDIVENNVFDVSKININTMAANAGSSSLEFAWDGFLWGFLCCPIGFFVVAINDDKTTDQKTSYWIGVAASVVLSAITTPVYYY
jgi:hypothetical protein